jgi:hypothetical protein
MGQPTEGDGYMIVARDLLPAVEALSTLPPSIHPRGCAMLAAHALECALKAFLSHKEKNGLRGEHDLLKLWEMACKEGLNIPQVPRDWVTTLSWGHGPNFYFRYQEGVKVTTKHVTVDSGSYPALVSMTTALKNLIETVGLAVKG